MKKFIIFLLIIILCIASVQAAQNVTKNVTVKATPTPYMEKYTEEFYGEITYMDGSPVKAGKIITAKDQYNNVLGNYTIKTDGVYGATRPRDPNLEVSLWRDPTDRVSRSTIVFVNFFVDNARAKDTVEFRQGEMTKFDIQLPVAAPTPTPTPTPVPTITTITTTVPTVIPTQIITTIPIPTSPSENFRNFIGRTLEPKDSDEVILIYGLIAGAIVIAGILIVGITQAILMSRSSRDEVLGPEGRQK